VLSPLSADTAGGGGGVLVGQPSEDIGILKDAGSLTVLPVPDASPAGPGPYGVTQDTPGVPGTVEAGDRFGAAVDGGWVGVPFEDVGSVADAGVVHGLRIGATGVTSEALLQQGQENGVALPGRPEAGDHFGASVLGARFGYDDECDVGAAVIGAPGEDVGTTKDAGEADIYFGHDRNPEFCRPGAAFNLGANARPGDRLGTAVARQDQSRQEAADDLLIGIPGYDLATILDAGVVLKVKSDGRIDRLYTLSDGALSGAGYGAILSR
jgi:hypothetical protein